MALPDSPTSRVEAYAMLTHAALSQLWNGSDFQPKEEDYEDVWGCCPVCCAPCAALRYLDAAGLLDAVCREWPEGMTSSMFKDGRVDRDWMYRQWSNPFTQQQCGHSLEAVSGG